MKRLMLKASLLFDRSLGYSFPKHFESKFGVKCFTRRDVVRWLGKNPNWKVANSKFIKFAQVKNCILVTGDYQMYRRALDQDLPSIFIWNKLPFWVRILRLLLKLDHPFFSLSNFIDLRLLWGDCGEWRKPSNPLSCKKQALTDET